MKLKDWMRKEGRKLNWLSSEIGIPISILYSYTSEKRSMPLKYIPRIVELTRGECSEEDLKGPPKP